VAPADAGGTSPQTKKTPGQRPGESNREASRLGDVGSWGSRVSTRPAETVRVEDL